MGKRGIGETLIREVLEKYSPEEERERARELARDKFERWQKLEPMKRRKRVYDFLVRRGFDFAMTRDLVEEIEKVV